MFQRWRQQIRQAEAAYRQGKLDEAGRLLKQENLYEFRPGKKLAAQVAADLARRACRVAALGNSRAGWQELALAAEFDAAGDALQQARASFLAQGTADLERLLAAGVWEAALSRLARLEERHGRSDQFDCLRSVARRLKSAEAALKRAEFSTAQEHYAAAGSLWPNLSWLAPLVAACTLKELAYREQTADLQAAIDDGDWTRVLNIATSLLSSAPESPLALAARRQAWEKLAARKVRRASEWPMAGGANSGDRAKSAPAAAKSPSQRQENPLVNDRYLLWIDAVGGFLVCTGNEIVLGRPADDTRVDVPILADLSRRQAVIRRDGETYLLEAVRETKLDGRPLTAMASLADGSLIELASGVEIRFRRPHPLSSSARLEIVSGHRTVPHVDAVLLMAESCVLGPAWHNHVVCRAWQQEVVLYRQQSELHCRSKTPLLFDGQPTAASQRLLPGMRIEGEDFAFSVEALAG